MNETTPLKSEAQAGLLHHSDRGCQYASADYRALLAARGLSANPGQAQ